MEETPVVDLLALRSAPTSRAFLVQDNPLLDFSPVRDYAVWPPQVIFAPGQVTLEPEYALAHARARLAAMTQSDYLLLSGDPVMIGLCFSIVAMLFGRVRVLRWDRREHIYIPIEINFGDLDGNR